MEECGRKNKILAGKLDIRENTLLLKLRYGLLKEEQKILPLSAKLSLMKSNQEGIAMLQNKSASFVLFTFNLSDKYLSRKKQLAHSFPIMKDNQHCAHDS